MDPSADYQFDEQFEVVESLGDGAEVLIRMLRPGDRELLARGFEKLSRRSRYQRFFSLKPSLSVGELDYLVSVDGRDHVAMGAVECDRPEEGVGVARFVRHEADSSSAEVAVTVVDAYQGRGVGRLLLEYLTRAALERGVERFSAECLATNEPMRRLFEELGPTRVVERADSVISLDIELDGPDEWDHPPAAQPD